MNKWTEEGLFIVYNDMMTNYALRIVLTKEPQGLSLDVTEPGPMICIKSDWRIGFKSFSRPDTTVSVFDLKKLRTSIR